MVEVQGGFIARTPHAFQQLRWEMERLAGESACLQRVSSILGGEGNLAGIFRDVAAVIEAAWQNSEDTRVRIVLDGQVHAAKPFEPTDRKLISDIIVAGDKRGQLEIYYLPELPDIDGGAFTGRQHKLAEALAGMMAQAAEKKTIAEALSFQSRMIEQTIEGIMALDLRGNILLANHTMAAMHGYEPEELIGEHYSALHTPEQMAYTEAVGHELLRVGKFVGEFGHVRRDGSVFPAMMRMALLRDDNGAAIGVIKTCLDITDRKQAEETADLARFTAENPSPVLRVRADGHVLYANPAAAAMVPEGTELVLAKVLPEWLPILARTLTSGRQEELEEQLGHRTLSFVFAPVVEGGYVNIYGRDITERKQAEEQIKQQQYYLEKAQELGRIGTWELDLVANRLYWTDENCRIFGVPAGSVVNYEIFIEKVHPDDRQYVDREWTAAINGKPYDIEHRILVDGVTRWVREKADVAFDDQAAAISAIGFTQDITERKEAEAEAAALAKFASENPSPILRLQADGHVLYANAAAAAMTPEGTELVLARAFPEWLPILARTLASGCQEELEEQLGHRTLSFVFSPVVEGDYVNIYGRDITDHKLAKLNQVFLDAMPCVAMLLRLSTREIVACNEPAKQAGCVVGNTCYGTWPKFDSPCPWCMAPKVWTTGQPQRLEVEALGTVWDIHWIPLAGDLYLRCSFDITDRKQTEEKLHTERRRLRALANELSLAEERVRLRLSAALHDDVSQELAAAKIRIGMLGREMKDSQHAQAIGDIFQTIDQALRHVSSLTFELCPPVLYRRGLVAGLEWLVGHFNHRHEVSFEFVGEDISLPLTDEVRGLVFQVVRELLTNVIKHAQARQVVVTVKTTEHDLTVMVVDDGVGFDPALATRHDNDMGGFGLFSIRQRISYLGGQLSIGSSGRRGSLITITIPVGNED